MGFVGFDPKGDRRNTDKNRPLPADRILTLYVVIQNNAQDSLLVLRLVLEVV